MILLNLSYIPDEVVHTIDFTKWGWSRNFASEMENYKKKWNEEHIEDRISPWKYQDEELEEAYNKFKQEKDKSDQGYKTTKLSQEDIQFMLNREIELKMK